MDAEEAGGEDGLRVGEDVRLGPLSVGASHVFFASPSGLSVALSRMQAITPGHTVVLPRRIVARLADLDDAELQDLWDTTRTAQSLLERLHKATACNIAVFDGPAAGQPVAHVHVHIVPRRAGDSLGDDKVHHALEQWTPQGIPSLNLTFGGVLEEKRQPRTQEMMAAEALQYRARCVALGGAEIPSSALKFAKFDIDASSVFFSSPTGLTVAFVNLKPLLPGHVLVTPRRVVPRLGQLSDDELFDLFWSVKVVQAAVTAELGVNSWNLGIQDGGDSGQSVPHVHVHVLPRAATR